MMDCRVKPGNDEAIVWNTTMHSDSSPSRLARLPVFYGWIIVAAAFVTMAIGVNARTAFSLLFPPILDEFGWDRGVVAGVFSFGFFVSAFVAPFVGRLMDRRGPRARGRDRRRAAWSPDSALRRSRARRGSST